MSYRKSVLESQKNLKIIEKRKGYLITKAKFGPSKETKIPLKIIEELSFFVATIIGDGHLKKSKLQISIELSNKKLIKYIQKICFQVFNRKFNIRPIKIRKGKKQSWVMVIDSKSIYHLLNLVFEIPIGKKSHIVKVPRIIINSNQSIKSAFLIGIMVTEGGRRHGNARYGLSTSSKRLWKNLVRLFKETGINVGTDKWTNKKYKKEYYGISFKKDCLIFLTGRCRSGQTGQILETCFQEDQA